MKRIYIILFIMIVFIVKVCGQATEINTININFLNGELISYPLTEIESVMHKSDGTVSFNALNEFHTYDSQDISSITFTHQDSQYYYLTGEEYDEWSEGVSDSNGNFLVCRQQEDGGYFAIIADGENPESTITFKFDSEFNIESIFSSQGHVSVITDDETKINYFVIVDNRGVTLKEVADINNQRQKIQRAISCPSDVLNVISGWINNALTIQDFVNILSNGADYLPGFLGGMLLTDKIWGYGNLTSLGISLFLNWAESQYENDYYRLLTNYMAGGNIYISDIDEENMPQYEIEATVYGGLDTTGKPLACSIHSGIAVKLDDSHVFYDDCDMRLNNHEINGDTKYTASLYANKGTTYYLRPYLIVMLNGLIEPTPFMRQPYLWGGKPQPLIIYGDVDNICFNPNFSPTTGEASDFTESSVTVECSYGELPKGAVCGVEYSEDGENYTFVSCANNGNTQKITLSGLEPMTSYTYIACVKFAGETYYAKSSKSFTTLPPDISGTWNCTQKTWQSWTQTYKEETYTITLHEDGTVSHTSSMSSLEPISGGWTYSQTGVLSISIMDIATQTQNHGIEWEFKTSTPKNPQEFEGQVYGWNFNSVIGYKRGDSSSCKLTR